MLRPKDIIDQLGISAPTLRVWSNTFAPVLSAGAQPSRAETGGSAQRRYDDHDLAVFRHAKALLASGSTFEQALATLQTEPLPEVAESLSRPEKPVTDVAVIEQAHPIIQAFEETIRTKDQVIASKDETIAALMAQLAERPAPTVVEPKFRWDWLNKLLTVETQDVG